MGGPDTGGSAITLRTATQSSRPCVLSKHIKEEGSRNREGELPLEGWFSFWQFCHVISLITNGEQL